MRILLIQPNSRIHSVGWRDIGISEPLGLQTIAGTVANHDVRILDMRFDDNLDKELASFQPDIVGITCLMTKDVYIVCDTLKKVKDFNSSIFTIVGGIHPTFAPQDFNKGFTNVIILGEGDESFREVVDCYQKGYDLARVDGIAYINNGELVFTNPRKQIENLDALPFPNKEATSKFSKKYSFLFKKNLASISTSRGCPYRCSFCIVQKFFPKFTYMSPERVIEALKNIKTRNIMIVDDNFLHDLERAERIYELIKAHGIKKRYGIQARSDTIAKRPDIIKKWAEVGLKRVLVGFETVNEDFMKDINKRNHITYNTEAIKILHEYDIAIIGLFLVDPKFDKNDFDQLADYIIENRICYPVITILTPFPGADIYDEKRDQLLTTDYEKYDMLHAVLPTKLPIREFYQQMARLYRKIYYSPGIAMYRIRKARTPIHQLHYLHKVTSSMIKDWENM